MVATSHFVSGVSKTVRRSSLVSAYGSGVAKRMILRRRETTATPAPKVSAPRGAFALVDGDRGNISAGERKGGGPTGATGAPVSSSGTRRSRTRPEALVRDALAASIPGARTEVCCSSGFVDVVTSEEIIEVKRAQLWKGGLGQVLVYSKDFPGLRPRLHLFGPRSYEHFALAHTACNLFGVSVTTEEGHAPPAAPGKETTAPSAAPKHAPSAMPKHAPSAASGHAPSVAPGNDAVLGAGNQKAKNNPSRPVIRLRRSPPPAVNGAPAKYRVPDGRRSWCGFGSACLAYVCGRSA